jgi:peroxiredoxin
MSNMLSVGQPLPELGLFTATNAPTTLAAHFGPRKTLLYFLHGTWRPECVGQFHLLQRYRPAILAADADVVVIASDDLDALTTFLASAVPPLEYTVLADPKHSAHSKLGLGGDTLATIVDGEGLVLWLARWADHHGEPGYEAMLQALREVPDVNASHSRSTPA